MLAPTASTFVALSGGGWFTITTWTLTLPEMCVAVLLGGAALSAVSLLYGIVLSRRLMFRARPFPDRESQEALLAGAKTMQNVSLPILFTSDDVKSPTVWSWGLHPAVLLPEKLTESLSKAERDAIFLHELAHISRRDHLLALLARVCGIVLFWQPLYWLVLYRSETAADESCDLLVLEQGNIQPQSYSEILLRLVAGETYRPVFQSLSRKEQMMKRISTILNFANRSGKVSAARKPLWTLAVLAATMLVTVTLAFCQEKKGANKSDAPKIVKMKPENGAKNVDAAAVKKLRVTFDKDMDSGGFSWTGGGEKYPQTTGKPKWIDKRTCVLPVNLEPGKEYQLGINSVSFKGFRSEEGVPVEPVQYQFSTGGTSQNKGANKSDAPKIVKMKPANGAKDVDAAAVKELRVTFDKDMDSGGFSWTGGGEKYPQTTGKPKWIDKRTCVLPVKLEPGKEYQLGINSASFKGFRSKEGVPVEPVQYQFSTGGTSQKKKKPADTGNTSTFLDELPPIKSPDNDAKPLPDGLLADIQKKREAIKSAEYTVQSVLNPAQKINAITKTAQFRFQGDDQWFVDISEMMANPDIKSDPKTFLSGCVDDKEWSYINNRYLKEPMYNVREWKNIKEKDISFLDPFKSKGSTVAEIQKRLDDQNIRYLGKRKFNGKKLHLFGFKNETTLPIDKSKTITTTGEIGIDTETLLPIYSRCLVQKGTPNGTSVSGYLFDIVSLNKEYAADDFRQKADAEAKPELKSKPDEGYQEFFIHIDDGAAGRMKVRTNGQRGTKGTNSTGVS
ncbi:hypothetical protein FACS189419_06320 [Planctomycetales bacterium]|nr:hypothetical protein FACS189419_06320 [Planctomycetales bacterium]